MPNYGVVIGRYEHINFWLLLERPRMVAAAAGHVLATVPGE
jgi:hypothetical protein